MLTKSQLNRLGERLAKSAPTEEDLRLLDEFRSSFQQAFEAVRAEIEERYGTTGRGAKTARSIIAKLKRTQTRLSKMQDIAGCRIVVKNIKAQNRCVAWIQRTLNVVWIDDRRERPSHGYRAMHVIVEHDGCTIEIQVRTRLQHDWAELCERLADTYGLELKYGDGPTFIIKMLGGLSSVIASHEGTETLLLDYPGVRGVSDPALRTKIRRGRAKYNGMLRRSRHVIQGIFRDIAEKLS
jgi:ppGpp synthetase/RelA/SpoT-type nucleotidyltranferase